jgi:hypothetical protein
MIRLYSILLIILLSAPFAYKSYIVGHYFYFLDYYANELCENKNEPEKYCNGVCQLQKELNAGGNSQENHNPQEFIKIEVSSFIVPKVNFCNESTNFDGRLNQSFFQISALCDGHNFEWIDPPIFS